MAPGPAHQDSGDVARDAVGKQLRGRVLAAQGHGLAAQFLGQGQRGLHTVPAAFAGQAALAGLHVGGDPGRLLTLGDALGQPHQLLAAGRVADADHQPVAGGPGAFDGLGLHVAEHLRVDAIGGGSHGQLAQGHQIAAAEEVGDGALGLLGNVDLALAQALQQLLRRQVHQLDVVGLFQYPVGQSLAHADVGDAFDDVVEAFEMLDVERGVDVDARTQDLLHVLIAFFVAAAGDVGMSQFVDQHQGRTALQHGVQVQLLEGAALVGDVPARHGGQAPGELFGFPAAVGFDNAHHQIDTLAQPSAGGGQHFVGLAHARRGAQEDLEATPCLPPGFGEQRVGGGAFGFFAHGMAGG